MDTVLTVAVILKFRSLSFSWRESLYDIVNTHKFDKDDRLDLCSRSYGSAGPLDGLDGEPGDVGDIEFEEKKGKGC